MNTVTDSVATVRDLESQVKAHCMCLRYESDATHYRVIYPDGYFPNGVQVSKRLGKAEALRRILDAMERHWKGSIP